MVMSTGLEPDVGGLTSLVSVRLERDDSPTLLVPNSAKKTAAEFSTIPRSPTFVLPLTTPSASPLHGAEVSLAYVICPFTAWLVQFVPLTVFRVRRPMLLADEAFSVK